MTFFIACVDLKTGVVTYANASHEPPYAISPTTDGKALTKKNLNPLIDASGPRLGDKKIAKYNEGSYVLKKGESILFYTDGILDLKNKAGETWGERKFIKSICDSSSSSPQAVDKLEKLKASISKYREGTDLIDDITILLIQNGEAA